MLRLRDLILKEFVRNDDRKGILGTPKGRLTIVVGRCCQVRLGGLPRDTDAPQYVTSYRAVEPRTFHYERERKMPLSGLDLSMLIGFWCKAGAVVPVLSYEVLKIIPFYHLFWLIHPSFPTQYMEYHTSCLLFK